MRCLGLGLAVAVYCLAASAPSVAQMSSDVKFPAGNFGTMVSGTIIGQEYVDYKLKVRAGQKMFIEMTVEDSNGSGTAYFNVLPPGSDGEAVYNSSVSGNTTTVPIATSGEYRIRVYHMGSDKTDKKTTGFRIDLSVQ